MYMCMKKNVYIYTHTHVTLDQTCVDIERVWFRNTYVDIERTHMLIYRI
jgi:hypothetical protein